MVPKATTPHPEVKLGEDFLSRNDLLIVIARVSICNFRSRLGRVWWSASLRLTESAVVWRRFEKRPRIGIQDSETWIPISVSMQN